MKNHKANAVRVICTAVNNFICHNWAGMERAVKRGVAQRGQLQLEEGDKLATWRISRCPCEHLGCVLSLTAALAELTFLLPPPSLSAGLQQLWGIYINEKKTLNVQRSKLACSARWQLPHLASLFLASFSARRDRNVSVAWSCAEFYATITSTGSRPNLPTDLRILSPLPLPSPVPFNVPFAFSLCMQTKCEINFCSAWTLPQPQSA